MNRYLMTLLLVILVNRAMADDCPIFGEPVNGLCLGVRGFSHWTSTDKDAELTVLLENRSPTPVTFPNIESFVENKGSAGQKEGSIPAGLSFNAVLSADSAPVTIPPGKTFVWQHVPLTRDVHSSLTDGDIMVSLKIQVPTGSLESRPVHLFTTKPSPTSLKLEGSFSLPKQTYALGEAIVTTFHLTNPR